MAGADRHQLLLILSTKMLIADREPIQGGGKKKVTLPGWLRSVFRVLLPALLGLTYLPILLFIRNRELALLFVTFSYFLFASMLLLITFSGQLADTSDNIILLPRPVNSRTMLLYRLLHTGYRFITASVPLSFAVVIALGLKYGWSSGLYYFLLTLPGLAIIFALVQLVLLTALRFISGQKFKRLIYWIQALLIGWFYLSMQHSFYDKLEQSDLSFTLQYSSFLSWMPQYWIARIWMHTAPWWMYLALWGSPLAALFFIVRVLAPRFSARLSEAASGTVKRNKTVVRQAKSFRTRRYIFLRHPAARAAYIFIRKFTARSPEYKMAVLPSYFYIVFTTVPVLKDAWTILSTGSGTIKEGKWLFPLYLLAYPLTTALLHLKISPQYKAAWIYETAPYRIKGQVRLGASWALFIRYYVPAYLLWSALALTITKGSLWADLLLVLVNSALIFLFQVLFFFREMPASIAQEDNKAQKQQGFFKTIFIVLLGLVLGGMHAFLFHAFYWWALLLLTGISLALCWLLWDKIGRTT